MLVPGNIAGVDVHRDSLQAALLASDGYLLQALKYPRTRAGVRMLARTLEAYKCGCVVMESTGHFWVYPYYELARLVPHVKVVLVNPFSTRAYRKKSDELDAERIARQGLAGNVITSNLPDTHKLYGFRQLCRSRVRLARERAKYANRIRKIYDMCGIRVGGVKEARRRLEELPYVYRVQVEVFLQAYDSLTEAMKKLEKAIAEEAAELFGELYELLQTVPGVGPLLAAVILAETVDFRRFRSADHYKSFCGLAPRLRESAGRARLGRCVKGNPYLRWAFYMAAVRGMRADKSLRAFYERLVERGKHRKVALVAVAAKLAKRTWVVGKRHVPYRPG